MPLRLSRKNTRNRVRNFVNRSPYGRDMAFGSFTKNQNSKQISKTLKSEQAGKIPPRQVDRGVDTMVALPSPNQVDSRVALGVDLGVDLPGRPGALDWAVLTCFGG